MRRHAILALFTLALSVTACAYYDDYGHGRGDPRFGDYRYDGGDFREPSELALGGFIGPGAAILDPWLAYTAEGRTIVRLGFEPGDHISGEMAHRANIWFRRYADHDRDLRLTDPEIRTALAHAARETDQSY